MARQDHRYNVLVVTAHWTPIGHTAVLTGPAVLLTGAAVALLSWALPRAPRPLARAGGLVMAVAAVGVGLPTLLSGLAARPVSLPGATAAQLVWLLAWPLLGLVGAVLALGRGSTRDGWFALLALSLAAAGPLLGGAMLAPALLDSSYDTAPWTELVYAGALALAAGLAVPATRSRPDAVVPAPPRVSALAR